MSVNTETLERIKMQLREAKDVGGKVPQDLYTHLTEVFNRILSHNPSSGFDDFEEISALVKQTHLKFQDPKLDVQINMPEKPRAATAKDIWMEKSRNLINEVRIQTNISAQ